MHNTKSALISTLFFCMSQGKNHYSTAAIKTILKLLKKFHKIEIKRRWLFQCLKDLTDAGLIKRNTRFEKGHNGLILQIPSIITFKLKGVVWLVKMGIKGAKEVYKSMTTYLQKEDKRFPKRKDFDDGSWGPADPEEKARLDGLLGIVGEKI